MKSVVSGLFVSTLLLATAVAQTSANTQTSGLHLANLSVGVGSKAQAQTKQLRQRLAGHQCHQAVSREHLETQRLPDRLPMTLVLPPVPVRAVVALWPRNSRRY